MGKLKVLDLFSGMGGLSSGFNKMGFSVTGADVSEAVGTVYRRLTRSNFIQADLSKVTFEDDYDYVIGGPPCKPWSSVNVTRRGKEHRDYQLVKKFTENVLAIKPSVFVLENVPPLRADLGFQKELRKLQKEGYSTKEYIFRYSDFGASTSRKRLFVIGLKEANHEIFLSAINSQRRSPETVSQAIWKYRGLQKGVHSDHQWPELRTIWKYLEYYETGKFGWTKLKWNEAAPSFGNVMKTYTLHPDSNPKSDNPRVVSVLEVARIMGFNHGFKFPKDTLMSQKYQMLADSVSPVFSEKLALALLRTAYL